MLKPIIAGKRLEAETSFEVLNPFDGSVVGKVATTSSAQADRALEAAEKSKDTVRALTRADRARVLRTVSETLLSRKEDLAMTLAKEVGKTIREARGEVERSANTFAFAAEEARRLGGDVIPFDAVPGGRARRGFSTRVPIGVVIAITPFNFPLNLAAHKVAPAMAAGNPFILKPASQTPVADIMLGEIILEAGYPPEAVSVVTGSGSTVGMQLVRDDRPRIVTFTGSVEVGKHIAGACGFKKIAMELGSNSAAVVAPSADLEFAIKRIVLGSFALAGQVCISVQRVLVENRLFDEVVRAMVAATARLKTGNQLEEGIDMGPMISEEDAARLETWIGEATASGAKTALGGTREGTLFAPTILTHVDAASRVWKDEAFGPVVCVNPYETFGEAMEAVNESRYGLQAGVFTNSVEEAFQAAEVLEVGGIIINDVPTYRVDQMPYGGMKDSGIGREGVRYAIQEMTEEKLVCFNFWKPE
jgi:glyceraldehyde-3-phosphate dehydrogenase (NADP+)